MSFKKYVRWRGDWGEGGGLKSKQKQTGGDGDLACVYAFFKKSTVIFKRKFYSHSPVFPIDYNGSMKYHHERFQYSVLSMNGVQSLSPVLFTLHNFSFFSLHCPLFSLRIFSKMATYSLVINNVYFVISS